MSTVTLSSARPAEVRLSPDGSRLFSADRDGYIRVYDTHSGALLHAWQIGQKLGGMDISPDGSFLVVVERNLSVTYRVDTATGAKTTFPYTTSGLDGLLFDVAILSDGTALFSQDFNGSGWTSLKVLNFGTGTYTAGQQVRQSSVFSRSPTGDRVLIGEPNISNGTIDIYQTGTGIIATNGAGGFNWGIQAFSGTLATHYIYNEGIHVYNAALQRQVTLTAWNQGAVTDLAFSADSAFLYVLDNVANTVVKISTADWSTVATIPVGADVGMWMGAGGPTQGDRLIVDKLGRYISVVTDIGLVLVENTAAPAVTGTGTADTLDGALFGDHLVGLGGNDVLRGWAGNDRLDGGAGADALDGGQGADTMTGGAGDDVYDVDDGSDVIVENSGEGSDTVRTTLSGYVLAPNLENLIYLGLGNATLTGNAANNMLMGYTGNDLLLPGTGTDAVHGADGDDGILFGAGFDPSDAADGGAGSDQLGLQGNYSAGLAFSATNMVSIETLVLLPGNDTRFGDTAGNFYDYALVTVDANVASGARLVVTWNTLRAGEDVVFDGSAETNGSFLTYGGAGADAVIGGQQGDGFYFGVQRWGTGDRVDGQGGSDQLGLQGDYTGGNAIAFGADQLTGIEVIVVLSGADTRFGGGGATFGYDLTMHDGNVAAGATLGISANALRAGEVLTFNGSAETNGAFRVFSGAGNDTIVGGAGGDQIYGAAGADRLTGGAGNDVFGYVLASHSTQAAHDTITDFGLGDRIDLSRIDANVHTAGDDAFTFIGAGAFTNVAGQLRAEDQGNGTWLVQGDTDGDGSADLWIEVFVPPESGHLLGSGDFAF